MKLGRLIGMAALGAVLAAEAAWVPPAPAHGDGHDGDADFGTRVERLLADQSEKWFGFGRPLARPSDATDYVPREAADANDRVRLAKGLKARFVARNVAQWGDQIAFWPNPDHYTHLIACIEQGRGGTTPGGNGGMNASVQRIDVETGQVDTILYGMHRCDPARTTPWGTVLVGEEDSNGRSYEILDPLHTTGHWVADRATGDVRDGVDSPTPSGNVVQRPLLGRIGFEGVAVLPSGVVLAGDELGPSNGNPGGAVYKFVPAHPRTGDGTIGDLADSPLAAGSLYALQVAAGSNIGQGHERGLGYWVGPVDPDDTRASAWGLDATGFYRPEDMDFDLAYAGEGVKVLWNNTGNEGGRNFADMLSLTDTDPLNPDSRPEVQRFLEGDERANSFDNVGSQPYTGNVYVVEDHPFGEVWACLPDGADRNLQTDGCVSMLSIVDPEAEPTGFIFDGSGRRAFLFLQHGETPASLADFGTNPVDGKTDDLLMITGFDGHHGHHDHP